MIKSIRKFFLVCSGATLDILNRPECKTEQTRYGMMGVFVFLTACFAALSGGYALYTGFKKLSLAVPVGILWGAFIFTLDRFIVSTIRKRHFNQTDSFREKAMNKLSEVVTASPRLVLAIFIAMTVAVPLEIKYFEPEINAQLGNNNLKTGEEVVAEVRRSMPEIAERERELEALDLQEKGLKEKWDTLRAQRLREVNGDSGAGLSGKAGYGPEARNRDAEFKNADNELQATLKTNAPRREKVKARLDELKATFAQRVEANLKLKEAGDGFLARLKALSELANDGSVRAATQFLVLLLTLIETTPVLIKLFAGRGPYDEVLEAEEHKIRINKKREISNFNTDLIKDLESYEATSEARRQMEDQLTRETMKFERFQDLVSQKIDEAQAEIVKARVEDWKSKELQKLAKVENSNGSLPRNKIVTS